MSILEWYQPLAWRRLSVQPPGTARGKWNSGRTVKGLVGESLTVHDLPIARPLRTRSWLSDTDCRVSACSYSRSLDWMCQTWWSCSRCAEELLFFVWFPWPLHRCLHSWTLELHGFVLLMRCLCSWQIPNLCQKHASFGGFQCPIPLAQECEDARSKLSDVRNRVEASRFQFLEPNCFRKERVLSGLLICALKQPCLKDLGRNQVSHSITLWKGKLQGQTHIA